MRGLDGLHSRSAERNAVVLRAPAVVPLSLLVAALAAAASTVGLWGGVRGPSVPFVTARGETVELVGGGLYRYDTVFAGAAQRGTDAVVLLLGVPLLLAATVLYRRGSSRAGLLLLGMHAFFLYVYGSAAVGTVAYNRLFVVYVAIFSATLFALAVLAAAVRRTVGQAWIAQEVPRRALGVFLLLSGAVTVVVWGVPVVSAVISGIPTETLDSYSTDVTYALDLAVIAPAALLAGMLVLRWAALGALLAVPLVTVEALLAPLIGAQTVSQLAMGVSLTAGQLAGPVGGFVAISLAAGWFLHVLLRAAAAPTTPVLHSRRTRTSRPLVRHAMRLRYDSSGGELDVHK
jgi:hypothetical protein